jgi:hypothetical protein
MSVIEVKIEYLEKNSSIWKYIEMLPEDYFDDDDLSWNSVPLHSHAVDYLTIENHEIQATKLFIFDSKNRAVRKITEFFWNNGKNRLTERFDEVQSLEEKEVITEILISENPEVWQILRCSYEDNFLKPNYHGFITVDGQGNEFENKLI